LNKIYIKDDDTLGTGLKTGDPIACNAVSGIAPAVGSNLNCTFKAGD
jgi:hypothetical protein